MIKTYDKRKLNSLGLVLTLAQTYCGYYKKLYLIKMFDEY